jgi:hypothetical protein
MSRNRKVLLAAAGAAAAALIGLLLTPVLFADQIEARVRSEVERAARLRVSWADASVGLFGDFPNPSLRLTDLTVEGTGSFENDTLVAVDRVAVSLDGRSLLRALRGHGPLVVRTARFDAPRLRLRVSEDGIASWDVTGGSEGPTAEGDVSPGLALSLTGLEVTDGDLVYDDAASRSYVAIRGLQHTLRGDFSRASLEASTVTHADALTVRLAGAPYLSDVQLDFEGSVQVDRESGEVRLVDQRMALNDLELRLDGSAARLGDAVSVDLTFEAPSSAFASVLSLASTLYRTDFSQLETSGTFALRGSVRGRYGPEDFPALSLLLTVEDGRFKYPDLPLPAEAITATLSVDNPGGSLDSTRVDLSGFHARIGEETFDASVRMTTPVSDPAIDLHVDGTLDLADVARTIKLPNADAPAGVVVADVTVRARRSDVEAQRYDRIDAHGTVSARDVALRGEALRRPVDVRALELVLSPSTAELRTFDAQLGSSDVAASGSLDNLLGFVLGSETLTGAGRFTSRRLVLDEWRSGGPIDAIPVPGGLDLTLDGTVEQLELNGLTMTDARGRAVVRDRRLTFENVDLRTLGGRVAVNGYYETTEPERPTFALSLGLDSLDIAETAASLPSFRAVAPIAQFARGTFTTDLDLSGALGQNLSPDLAALEGDGDFATSPMIVEGFPLLERLSERLDLSRLSSPTVEAIRSGIHIEGGRLLIEPLRATVGGLGMNVTGSNGFDQSIDYTLTVEIPRTGLAGGALDALTAAAGPLGSRLASVDPLPVRVHATGLVREPSLDLAWGDVTRSVQEGIAQAAEESARAAVQPEIDEARERAEAAEAAARAEAQARADSVVTAAERQAETIRTEGTRAAAQIRAEADRAAEQLLARASNPLQRVAAERAADELRSEADQRATQVEQEAGARADALVEEARARAQQILAGVGG